MQWHCFSIYPIWKENDECKRENAVMKSMWIYILMLTVMIALLPLTPSAGGVVDDNEQLSSQNGISGASSVSGQSVSAPPAIPIWFLLRLVRNLLMVLVPLGLLILGMLSIIPYRIPPGPGLWGGATIMTVGSMLYFTLAPGKIVKGVNLLPFREIVSALQHFSIQAEPTFPAIPPWFLVNLLGNLVFFLPLGVVLTGFLSCWIHRVSATIVILIGCLFSVGIEVIQLAIPTRATDVDDVIFNTVGTGLGFMFFFFGQHVWQRTNVIFTRSKKCREYTN
jgi:glycopeptide antibiotics resistance protein